MVPLFPGRIGNEVLVFGEEKNRMTQIGNLGERTRTTVMGSEYSHNDGM